MKRILISLLLALTFCVSAYGADTEKGTVAELYETNTGRSVFADNSEIVTIWYEGSSSGAIGVSTFTVGSTSTLNFYENGQLITATRFGGSATIDLDANDAEKVVSLINSETSKVFKANLGRDATPGTSTAHLLYLPVVILLSTEQDAIDASADGITPNTVLLEDTSSALISRAGFVPDLRKTYRLKRIEETMEGTGVHLIKVWDGERVVYRRAYADKTNYSGTGVLGSDTYIASVTPLTIDFAITTKGLSGRKGKNLTVTSQWNTSQDGTTEEDTNLSIIVGDWQG